jgi:hypothetical protein
MFLRKACSLPEGLVLVEKQFCESWMSVDETASSLDLKVRGVGWEFIWLKDTCSRLGFGGTESSAMDKAITRGLDQIKRKFNAAELSDVRIRRYPGFRAATVILNARQIQQEVLLSPIDSIATRHHLALR